MFWSLHLCHCRWTGHRRRGCCRWPAAVPTPWCSPTRKEVSGLVKGAEAGGPGLSSAEYKAACSPGAVPDDSQKLHLAYSGPGMAQLLTWLCAFCPLTTKWGAASRGLGLILAGE